LLPQSLPIIIPPWVNTAAEIVKGTSLVVLVSMSDLLFATRKIAERTGDVLPLYGAAAVIYFVICFTISRVGIWLGGRYRYGVAQ
jgi:ABC-type amino acid transport system permease subunit